MLAVPGVPFTEEGWFFEPKLDGTRCIAHVLGDRIVLQNRRLTDIGGRYPELLISLRTSVRRSCILDGEIVVFVEGQIDFHALQKREQQQKRLKIEILSQMLPATYILFDILEIEGDRQMHLPLRERKDLLSRHVEESERVAVTDYIETIGESYYRAAIKQGLEGIMAKRAESTYQPGVRSSDWKKIKKEIEFDLVVGGMTRGAGYRANTFGALLLGAYQGEKLLYVGKVGTGFSFEELQILRKILETQPESPFVNPPNVPGITWVNPTLVVEIQAMEVTEDGKLRAPVYLRLRNDKPPAQCTYDQLEQDQKP
jgi:DNA ligase D-like protein (predicted ligase)